MGNWVPHLPNTPSPQHPISSPMPRIAKVLVDLAINREFDYLVPDELADRIKAGSPVLVPFGKRELRGFVVGFADASEHANLKPVKAAVGGKSLVDERILQLARWVADYYCAPVELALRTALPAAVRRKPAGFKKALHVTATEKAADETELRRLRLRAPKQASALDLLKLHPGIPLQKLAQDAGVTTAVIRGLEKKSFVAIADAVVRRDPYSRDEIVPSIPHALMPQQEEALQAVREAGRDGKPGVVLLFGVTGSGKTEVYLQAIEEARQQGRGAIVLVPEIALTPQTVDRFRSRFGDIVAVLHSELSDGERHDEWHRIHEGRANIVIGPRSAIFAPVRELGVIIVDEEHEHTYKQEETPRYNARDVAVMRGHMEKCPVILGSATPSLESLWNARKGKYRMLRMGARVDHQRMPQMHIVDMREEMGREGRLNVLSRDLIGAVNDRLSRGEQVMLFLNRRGFATSLTCPACGEAATCPQCGVPFVYHRATNRLLCHYCALEQPVPQACPNKDCRDPKFRFGGIGTQRVEDVIQKCFPRAVIQRMDSDTMTKKDDYRDALMGFRTGKVDILIGTQMIAKGLHFPNVTLVGVINADIGLHAPDFRAGEKTFQILTQVAGRAGRGDVAGEVYVQTFTPQHPAIQAARRLDYDGFFDQEIEARKELGYPPCGHLVCVHLRGPVEELTRLAGETFFRRVRPLLGADVVAAEPTPSPIERIRNEFRFQMAFRAPRTADITGPLKAALKGFTWPADVSWSIDVDALSLL